MRTLGEGVAMNPGQEGRFQRVDDAACTETVPSRAEVRQLVRGWS